MLENFVEKYVPIRIQSQISDTLSNCLGGVRKCLASLAEFEKNKFAEMH